MPFVDGPRFPPINQAPTPAAVFKEMGPSDAAWFATNTAVAGLWGWLAGKPFRQTHFWFLASFGFIAAVCSSYRQREFQLLGYHNNEQMCIRRGIEFRELREPVGLESS